MNVGAVPQAGPPLHVWTIRLNHPFPLFPYPIFSTLIMLVPPPAKSGCPAMST